MFIWKETPLHNTKRNVLKEFEHISYPRINFIKTARVLILKSRGFPSILGNVALSTTGAESMAKDHRRKEELPEK